MHLLKDSVSPVSKLVIKMLTQHLVISPSMHSSEVEQVDVMLESSFASIA
jgi:hypothetical protein